MICFDGSLPNDQLVDYISFKNAYDLPGKDYMSLNGLPLYSQEELRNLLSILSQTGIRVVNLSFFGIENIHDKFARRFGDFDYLLTIARIITEYGLLRSESIFLRKPTLKILPELVRMLDNIPGLAERHFSFFDYRGLAVKLDDERPEYTDITALPDNILENINFNTYRPEAEWYRRIMSNELPMKTLRVHSIVVNNRNANYLEREPCDKILASLQKREEQRRIIEPSLISLANIYGDKEGYKMYALRDLEWKWMLNFYIDQQNKHSLRRITRHQSSIEYK